MSKINKLKDVLSSTKEKIKQTTEKAEEKLKDIDIKEVANKAVDSIKSKVDDIQDSIENFDIDEAKESAVSMVKEGGASLAKHFKNLKETSSKAKSILNATEDNSDKLCVSDALKIMGYLIASDKRIDDIEKQQIAAIKNDLDNNDSNELEVIMGEVEDTIKHSNDDDYMEYILDGVQDALANSKKEGNGTVDKKLLLWNLLALAYQDNVYSDVEKQIIRTVNRRMDIDQSIVLDLESAIKAINAIAIEIDEIKNNSKSQEYIDELENRKNIILKSVYELIED